jgi:hypothetical protein
LFDKYFFLQEEELDDDFEREFVSDVSSSDEEEDLDDEEQSDDLDSDADSSEGDESSEVDSEDEVKKKINKKAGKKRKLSIIHLLSRCSKSQSGIRTRRRRSSKDARLVIIFISYII